MASISLEKYKKKYKDFNSKISSLESFLSSYSGKKDSIAFSVDQFSQVLHTPPTETLFLLSLAEKENLVHKKYEVWANDDSNALGEYENKNDIPDLIYDPSSNKEIKKDNFYVVIVFEIK